jgi:hypothetical protein
MPPQPKITPEYSPVPGVAPKQTRDPSELVHINFPEVRLSRGVGEAMAEVGRLGYGTLSAAQRGLGEAFDNLGNQLEHTGDKLWNRALGLKELQVETDVKKREIEYERWLNDKDVKFQQLQGDGASEEVLKAHMKEVEEKRNQMGAGLPPKGQLMWDRLTANSMLNSMKGAATHAAKETRAAAGAASGARISMKIDQFSKEDDIKRSEELFKQTYDEFWNTKRYIHGWSDDQAKAEWAKITDQMYASKISRYADEDATRALKMLQENKDMLDGKTYDKLDGEVRHKFRQQKSVGIAKQIQDQDPDASYEDKRKKIPDIIKKLEANTGIKDPLLEHEADQQLSALHRKYKIEESEQYKQNHDNAMDAAFGYGGPDGRKPESKAEFDLIPGAKEAYSALKPNDKNKIDQILLKNLEKGHDYPPTLATRNRVIELKGEAQSTNPEEREKFMLRNFRDEKIPLDEQDKLFAIQRKMRTDIYKEDPHLTRGMRTVDDMLPNNWSTRSPTAYKQFKGAFYEALQAKMEENKGVPLKADEYREIAAQLLRTLPGTGWISDKQMYQVITQPSNEDLRQMKNLYPYATDKQLIDAYTRMQWTKYNKEYEKLKSLGKTPTVTPPKKTGPTVPTSQ